MKQLDRLVTDDISIKSNEALGIALGPGVIIDISNQSLRAN